MTAPPPTAPAIIKVNESMIDHLWLFDSDQAQHAPQGSTSRRYAYQAIRQIWALQHSKLLPRGVGNALVQALRVTLNGLRVPPDLQAWVSMLDAQQHSLVGEYEQAQHIISTQLLNQARSEVSDAWACAACAAFHDAWIRLSSPDADAELFGARTRTELIGRHMGPVLAILEKIGSNRQSLGPKMQAHLLRMSVVANRFSGLSVERVAWLQLASDVSSAQPSMAQAYSRLVSGWGFLADGQPDRAEYSLESASTSARQIGWGFGEWLASYELDCLRHRDDAHDIRLARLAKIRHSVLADIHPEASFVLGAAPSRRDRVMSAKDYIAANMGRRVSVQEVASHCLVSSRTLSHDFGQELGKRPLDYINEQKILYAQQLISEGKSVREASMAVGFDSTLGFIKAYVRVQGIPPPGYTGRA